MSGLVATTRVHGSANRNQILSGFLSGNSIAGTRQYAVSYWLAAITTTGQASGSTVISCCLANAR